MVQCVGVVGQSTLMGGAGFAAAIDALERASGRGLVWASAQFLSRAVLGASLDVEVEILASGRRTSQARVRLHDVGRAIMDVNAAVMVWGDDAGDRQFVAPPDVPDPDACPLRRPRWQQDGDLLDIFERRRLPPEESEGRDRTWVRCLVDAPVSAGLLAIVADFLPGGHAGSEGSSSLDNSLRIHAIEKTEWMLCDTRFSGFASGVFHGDMRIFSERGALLATAAQSGRLPKRTSWSIPAPTGML